MDSEKLQEKYFEMQMLEQQINHIKKQIEQFDAHVAELQGSVETLNDLKEAGKGNEMLVPVAGGIFMKASIADADKLVVNVGSQVAVEKSVEDTQKIVSTQIGEMMQYREQLIENMRKLVEHYGRIEQELEKLVHHEHDENCNHD